MNKSSSADYADFAEGTEKDSNAYRLDKWDWAALIALATAATLVRWKADEWLPAILHLDSESYFEIAQRLWRGEGFGDLSRRPPLYPLLLWATGLAPQSGFRLTLLAQHLLGIVTALLLYLTARRLLGANGRVPALLAGAVCAVAGCLVILEHSILSESLYVFLLVNAAYFLVGWCQQGGQKSKWLRAAGVGAALGLACLTRPVALIIFPLWAALLFLLTPRKSALQFSLIAGAAWAALILPLLIRNQLVMGSFALTQSAGRNLISVTDLVADYAREPHREIRSIYHRYLADKRGPDAVIVYSAMPELRQATGLSDAAIDRALAKISWEAIGEHPLKFLGSRLRRLPLLVRDPGISQWYALHAETYLPLVEFSGRMNAELASRAVLAKPLPQVEFARAANLVGALSFPLGGGWALALAMLGAAGCVSKTIIGGRHQTGTACGGALIFAALAASWLAAILMQPPNLRYRMATLPWEFLLAGAGLAVIAEGAVAAARRASVLWGKPGGKTIPEVYPRMTVYAIALVTLSAITSTPGNSLVQMEILVDSANAPPAGEPLMRMMPVGGRTLPMIYWRSDYPAARNIAAQAAVPDGGGTYRLRAAFSCGEATCAGGRLRLTAFEALGTPLGAQELPLAQERTDNDWFWEQIDERIRLPRGTAKMRMEIFFEPGQGSLVMPLLTLSPLSTLSRQ